MIDGKAGLELWDATLRFISEVDARFLAKSELTRVGDHPVKADLSAYLLEVIVFGISKSASEIDFIRIRDCDRVGGVNYLFIQSGQPGNQFDCGARFEAFT